MFYKFIALSYLLLAAWRSSRLELSGTSYRELEELEYR